MEAQASRVTALCWAQTCSLWVVDQPAACQSRAAESLLVGRLDGSLCWLQVTLQEPDLLVKSTELTDCYRKEGEKPAVPRPHTQNTSIIVHLKTTTQTMVATVVIIMFPPNWPTVSDLSPPAPQCVAWHSEDKPFAVGYPNGKILLATTGTDEEDQPVVLSVYQVCPHAHFRSILLSVPLKECVCPDYRIV